MSTLREPFDRGQAYAEIHGTKDAIIRACQVGIPAVMAWNLPVAWYWRIIAFLVLLQLVATIVTSLRTRRDRFHSLRAEELDHLKRGMWNEEMEAWSRRNPTAPREDQLAEAGRLLDKFGLRAPPLFVGQDCSPILASTNLASADPVTDALSAARATDARHDYADELTLLRPLVEQGNADAMLDMAVMYANGRGTPRDDAEGLRLLRKAAELGSGSAQGNLGVLYREGRGVPQDDTEAARWSRKGAEQGYAAAQDNLAVMYHEGRGVPQDDAEAARWYRKAADQGDADGQFNLGAMYLVGKGVPHQDFVEAYVWLTLAATKGYNEALKGIDYLKRSLTAEQLAEAQQRAAKWKPVHPRHENQQ